MDACFQLVTQGISLSDRQSGVLDINVRVEFPDRKRPVMNAKRKGLRNKHKAIRILQAAGSLGLFDIIAVSSHGVRLVQVKSNRNAPPSEREVIQEFPGLPPNALFPMT